MNGASGFCVWLTGPPAAGKSTVGRALTEALRAKGTAAVLLDDGEVEAHLAPAPDGTRLAALAWLLGQLCACGAHAVVAADPARRGDRARVQAAAPVVVEVLVDAPREARVARGGGPDGDYEEPLAPDLRVPTHDRNAAASTAQIVSHLEAAGLVTPDGPGETGDR